MVFIYCFAATLADLSLQLVLLTPSVMYAIYLHVPTYICANTLIMTFWKLNAANFRSLLVYTIIAALNCFAMFFFVLNRELKRFY